VSNAEPGNYCVREALAAASASRNYLLPSDEEYRLAVLAGVRNYADQLLAE
jgi:hypothetical protein